MRIGRAGEMGVTYACVITETYRHFGRLGLGAVFGSKRSRPGRLGPALAPGRRQASLPGSLRRHLYEAATQSSTMKKYHELGTAMNVLPLNAIGALPTRNLQQGRFEGAEAISASAWPRSTWGAASPAPTVPWPASTWPRCAIPYPKEPYFYKTSMIGYDHEPIFAVGSMLGGPT
jgi:aldehyde:ferredoxin oxidoreductase